MSERPERLAAYDLTCLDRNLSQTPLARPVELLTLTSTWLVALFTTVWLELLVQRYMPVTGLRIAMREMPASAKFATVHP